MCACAYTRMRMCMRKHAHIRVSGDVSVHACTDVSEDVHTVCERGAGRRRAAASPHGSPGVREERGGPVLSLWVTPQPGAASAPRPAPGAGRATGAQKQARFSISLFSSDTQPASPAPHKRPIFQGPGNPLESPWDVPPGVQKPHGIERDFSDEGVIRHHHGHRPEQGLRKRRPWEPEPARRTQGRACPPGSGERREH